ncbi:slit homolog 3 protein [Cryptotermes secundus]|uniref:slit homolog 3 protein n=1 Tax=Cryptotermes secundus TaxID=105785 RepID=UPI000CD7BE86|nr:slit homolog 3 protein [Cryptotermes secundus]
MLTTPKSLAFVAMILLGAASGDCPSPCSCYSGGVDCSNRGLIHLKKDMFNWIGAQELPELTLENNRLILLPGHIFDPLWGLKTLNLNHNQLRILEVGVFSRLRNLRFLDMKDNQLVTLPIGLFEYQNKLISLDVRNNLLSTLDVETVSPMFNLNSLAIKGNPLNCDCNLQPVVIWSSGNIDNTDAECHFPPEYSNLSWYVLASALCTVLPFTASLAPSENVTDICIEMSTSVVDNYTEILSTTGAEPGSMQRRFNSFSGGNITMALLVFFNLLVLTVPLVFVF